MIKRQDASVSASRLAVDSNAALSSSSSSFLFSNTALHFVILLLDGHRGHKVRYRFTHNFIGNPLHPILPNVWRGVR